MSDAIDTAIVHGQEQMDHTIEHLKKELTKIRTGKASPAMLEGLQVEYYGNPTALQQVANVGTKQGFICSIHFQGLPVAVHGA